MMPMLQHFGVGSIPWSPLAGGREPFSPVPPPHLLVMLSVLALCRFLSLYSLCPAALTYKHAMLTSELARPATGTEPTERAKENPNWKMPDTTHPVINKVQEIAEKRGVSMAQVALAWSLAKPFVSAPIVGTTSIDKLEDLIKGCEVELTDEEVKAIDELYKPLPVMGHS